MQGGSSNRDLSDTFQDLLSGACRLLFWLGVGLTAIGAGVLIYYCFATGGGASASVDKQALANIHILDKALYAGLGSLAVGSTVLFWGEQILAILQIVLGAILYTAPLWLSQAGASATSDTAKDSMSALQTGGLIFGGIGICVLAVDIVMRSKDRVKVGSKADQLKYGKGVKEEPDKQNVFLGKCWQLPYCRKFVREKCPIYHAKRSCWRELTGCMCEEDVIRGAMENRAIPKDALLAANYIPKNNKLTIAQKRDRCKTCVIYNEHQKHKYKALVPAVLIFFGLIYAVGHGPLIAATQGLIDHMSGVVHTVTLTKGGDKANEPAGWFTEMLLFMIFMLGLSYAMKVLEYMVFTLKV